MYYTSRRRCGGTNYRDTWKRMEGDLPNDSSDLRTDLISSFPVTLLLFMFEHARLVTVTFLPEQKLKLRIVDNESVSVSARRTHFSACPGCTPEVEKGDA